MRRQTIRIGLLVLALASAGCGTVEPVDIQAGGPEVVCDQAQIDPPPLLECEAAVLAALEQIQPGVVALASFHHGRPCGANMRCPFGDPNMGHVVLRLVDGRCAYVSVAVQPAEVVPPRISVSRLAAWPPADWPDDGVNAQVDCR